MRLLSLAPAIAISVIVILSDGFSVWWDVQDMILVALASPVALVSFASYLREKKFSTLCFSLGLLLSSVPWIGVNFMDFSFTRTDLASGEPIRSYFYYVAKASVFFQYLFIALAVLSTSRTPENKK
jgi:hypothetical protein